MLSSFQTYLQSPPGQHDVKEQKTLNWHELIQIPALLFKSWPPSDQWCGQSFSVSSSVKWGQHLLWSLLWGLEIISIRFQNRAWCTDLTPKSCEKPCACVQMMEQNKTGPSREMRDVNRTQQEERRVQDGSMGECAWDEPGKMGRIWQAMRGGAIPQGRKAVKEGGLLLLDSYVQPSSARASCPAHINHFSSLLHGASTVSLHHHWRAFDVLLDGWHQTSITIS